MPFTDGVSSISGRNSRASNVSAMTGASRSIRSAVPPTGNPQDALSNAGVLSMLKTSTDTGDIGALSFNHSRLPNMPRAAHTRRGHFSRPSDSSHPFPMGPPSHHNYAPSQTSRISDSASYQQRRGSLTSLHSMPPSLQQLNGHRMPLQMPQQMSALDNRSYSLTSAPIGEPLPRHRSATSLKSAGHEPRHLHHLHPSQVPPMPEHRPPYVYPARLKRPGYRSPSPALSDLSSQGMPPVPPPVARRMPMPMPMNRPQPQTYHSDYAADYGQDPRYFNARPTRPPNNGPPAAMYDPMAYGYRQHPARAGQGMPMGPTPPPHQVPYGGPQYPQRAPYQPYPQHSGQPRPHNRGPPPVSNMAVVGNSIFQNAARMARQLPQRTDTPMTDSVPSSDPPSSGGTAPTSSNPPTPKDQTTIQVAVDPLFIDPALTDLPDSSSEPVLPGTKYFQYAEGVNKPLEELEIEVNSRHPSVAPTGLVQRVKAMLESRAVIEAREKQEIEHEKIVCGNPVTSDHDTDIAYIDLHELSANQTPRFTVIEEFEAPVELPASPVRIPELSATPLVSRHIRHLTREFVKAELAPSSNSNSPPTQDDVHLDKKEDARLPTAHDSPREKSIANLVKEQQCTRTSTEQAQKSAVPEPAIIGSPETRLVSGIDYALQFSVPVDTTFDTEETQSKDPFALDADTITLRHQRSKDNLPHRRETRRPSISSQSYVPSRQISPLKPHEDNNTRSSTVSPLPTEAFGADDLLGVGAKSKENGYLDNSDSTLLKLYEEDKYQPSHAQRAHQVHSKSVQLPQVNIDLTDTPGSNRMSLPPDLNSLGDTSMNTTSEMITDVAVRFSLPTTTITIGKPQIITIPPSSSPPRREDSPVRFQSFGLDPKSARRSSVTFADHVAPLNIKKTEARRDTQNGESAMSILKSIVRRPSPMEDVTESSRASSTTDLRLSTGPNLNSRFGQLPGLKEESVDDMSINEHQKQSLEIANGLEFSLPARIAAVKAMQERRLQESADKAKARRAARYANRPLSDISDLPSLNFSRMDLIDKLNEALDTRGTKSMDVARHRHISTIYCPSPQRPQSTEPLRERYTSFFCKPQDFTLFDESFNEEGNETEPDIKPPSVLAKSFKSKPDSIYSGSRQLSPEDLLQVATQINRLSIPSVAGLSTRLTELLPCLKNLHLDSVLANDEEVANTIDDIQHLGRGGQRPETVLSARTSAGFRTLAERAEDIVQNGTHDSVLPGSRAQSVNKELPPLPESTSADKVSAVNSTDGKQSRLSGSVSAPSELGQAPKLPELALLRQKSPMTEEEVRQLLPPESNPIARGLKRTLMLSGGSTRPWNLDENYPWSGTSIAMDLTISSGNQTRESILQGRRTKSLDITSSFDDTRGIDIGSITTTNDCSASITTEQATGVKTILHRRLSKHSIIGTITRKIGLSHRSNGESTPLNVKSPARPDETLPHKVGDRYPTTGLTPPIAYNLDEVRSFFSDNSSERGRNTSFRKRLTGLKGTNSAHKSRTTQRFDGAAGDASPEDESGMETASLPLPMTTSDRFGIAPSSALACEGVGMGKTEFRIKRLGEKLRHLFAKGGLLLRTWSVKSHVLRTESVREDWLSDSVYSGV